MRRGSGLVTAPQLTNPEKSKTKETPVPPPDPMPILPESPASKPERQAALRRMLRGIDFDPLMEVWCASEGGIAEELESGILAVLYEVCAERAIRQGEVFMAEDLARLGQKRAAAAGFDDLKCFQLQALALARAGATRRAAELLLRLSKVAKDPESFGLLARTFRDLGWEEPDREVRETLFREAHFYANESLKRNPDCYYNAIQAAQFAFFAGDSDLVNIHLKRVEAICRNEQERDHPANSQENYWINVTLAEAALIRGDAGTAEARYRAMAEEEDTYPADTEASRRVAFELIRHHGDTPHFERLRGILKPRPVMVFSGHLFDCGRTTPRLPVAWEETISRSLDEVFEKVRPRTVFASLSFGTDLLFVESAIRFYRKDVKRQGDGTVGQGHPPPLPVHLVVAFDLPRTVADFRSSAGRVSPGTDPPHTDSFPGSWLSRLHGVLAAVPHSHLLEARYPEIGESSTAYAHANALLIGMARLAANHSGASLIPVVLHDGEGGEQGGVGDLVTALPEDLRANLVNLYPNPSGGK